MTAIISGLFPLKLVGELVSIVALLAFTIVCVSVIILRRTRPDLERAFRGSWHPVFPVVGAIVCLAQMIFLPVTTWLRLGVWLIIGLVILCLSGCFSKPQGVV